MAADGRVAPLLACRRLRPDVVLMYIHTSAMDDLEGADERQAAVQVVTR
ncbi:hypothetical protein OG866_01880 [Streptomyces sp. NBC_00663]|nr:hypothetical protein [Streptomyces sp. NBC_00663]